MRSNMLVHTFSVMRRAVLCCTSQSAQVVCLSAVCLLTLLCTGCDHDDQSESPVQPNPPPQAQDRTAPVATIVFPGTTALLTSAPISVRGTAQDQSTITDVAVNGVPATSTDGFTTWVARVTLPLGMSEVVVSTTDAVGNTEARAAVALVTVVETLLPFQDPEGMAVEASGTLVVVDFGLGVVVRVNPQTGARSIVADATTGSGPALEVPRAIAVEASGALVVTDYNPGVRWAVVRVDPQTGARSIVADATTGSGPPLLAVVHIAVEATGTLVVTGSIPADDSLISAIVRVDPQTGARTILADATSSGPLLESIYGIAVEASGALVVASRDPSRGQPVLVRVDPQTGAQTIISDAATGSGPPLLYADSIAVEAAGTLVVKGKRDGQEAVMRVDPTTGARSIVSDATTGSGPPFGPRVLGIAVEPTGDLVVIDEAQDTVVRVDAVTGNRTVISSSAVIGSGPALAPALAPDSIAASATGTLFVTGFDALFEVDPRTGTRRVVASGLFESFSDIAVEASGTVIGVRQIFIDVPCRRELTRVDPTTGSHHGFGLACPITVAVEATGSLVASFWMDPRHTFLPHMLIRLDPSTGQGTPIVTSRGPALQIIRNIAVESTGTFVVVDSGLNSVVRINEQTGERTIISDATTGSGPPFQQLGNMEVEATGDLVTVDHGRVLRINPVTGDRTIVSAASTGSGLAFFAPAKIAVEPTGTLVVTDPKLGAVVRVDPSSGDRVIISR
jgi:sugar lactone lactonase YvrE